jgi:hypothetical protein
MIFSQKFVDLYSATTPTFLASANEKLFKRPGVSQEEELEEMLL